MTVPCLDRCVVSIWARTSLDGPLLLPAQLEATTWPPWPLHGQGARERLGPAGATIRWLETIRARFFMQDSGGGCCAVESVGFHSHRYTLTEAGGPAGRPKEGSFPVAAETGTARALRGCYTSAQSQPRGQEQCHMQFTNKQSRATCPTEEQLLPGHLAGRPDRLESRQRGTWPTQVVLEGTVSCGPAVVSQQGTVPGRSCPGFQEAAARAKRWRIRRCPSQRHTQCPGYHRRQESEGPYISTQDLLGCQH